MRLRQTLEQISKAMNETISMVSVVLAFMMFFSTLLQVVNRYITATGNFTWTEEVARYCMIYLAFLGASMLIREDKNTAVLFILERMRKKLKLVIEYAILIVMLVFVLTIFYIAVTQLPKYSLREKSTVLMMSMLVPKSSVFVGMFCVSIQLIIRIIIKTLDLNVNKTESPKLNEEVRV